MADDNARERPVVEKNSSYGDCEGPESIYVKLVSSDGHEFVIKRKYALVSGTIAAMLTGPGEFAENETNEINFKDIPSHILEKVCLYMMYNNHYTNWTLECPLEFKISPKIALDLLMTANFLDFEKIVILQMK